MRFLCLHGRGTNATKSSRHDNQAETATAKIRDVIGQDNEFVFIDGQIAADVVPGIGSIAASQDERFAFVPLGAEPAVYRDFFLDLRDFVQSHGPFDGLVGFSEGASIAMTMMVEDAVRPFAGFKCAILFCALAALDPAPLVAEPSVLRFLDPICDKAAVGVPTAHIWSSIDDVARGVSRKMAEICDERTREVSVHCLGHDIPGSRSDESLAAALRVIERTIEKGKSG